LVVLKGVATFVGLAALNEQIFLGVEFHNVD
jgi:hypothetical protein